MSQPPRYHYMRQAYDDALVDYWHLIHDWRDAVADWQIAREAYDAAPDDAFAYHRLKAAEGRIARLRVIGAELPAIRRRSRNNGGRLLARLARALQRAEDAHPGTLWVLAVCAATLAYVVLRVAGW